ncbi:CopG family antitoxin [Spirulina sp. 06S082]|uniref:CopG family antitoxin n=1 Tax=Spirulina sp. 06S082 TaxID=3110248 RepID=UPI002B216B47|nr:CopG family antitoxin [Spirulina sp. 06S082]MEA5470097.1 CopG family antitoxin [Spirulina sp. 06S082]
MNTHKIPSTDSIDKLAQFWDTHDLTDFEDQLEEVQEPIFERKVTLQIDLDPRQIQQIQEIAKAKGLDNISLIQDWISEKLKAS